MTERNTFFIGLSLVAIIVAMLTPVVSLGRDDTSARIEKLEEQLQSIQAELEKLKAQKAPPVDQKQLEEALDKALADRPHRQLKPTDLRAFWKDGLRLESQDKDFQMRIGGQFFHDWMWASEDDNIKADTAVPVGGDPLGDQQDGAEFRQARPYIAGLLYGNVGYKLQLEFAGGDADLKDAYIALTDFPLAHLKMGHFKEPFNLEELTSRKCITFMERALPTAFTPARNVGVMLYDTALGQRMTWAGGLFRDADDNGSVEDDGAYSLTGRVTALPWYDPQAASLLHVGAGVSLRNTSAQTERFSSRPEAHLFDTIVDTNSFASDHVELLGLEAAWVDGPFSLQGEYIFADADDPGGSANFDGYYIQASYFLTGEHRPYKPSAGAFDRLRPKENFGFGGGTGAWEVALRYSELDLNDGTINAGELDNVTAGLNWYVNPNTRVMWNYVHTAKDSVGNADILLMRLQIDF
ncbi:MAG: OprO/OprP family phosphate-selective porin [Planctomycetota bacterium]